MTFAYVWTYRVRESSVDDFRRAYGSDGDWVSLFRRSDGYIDTVLMRDAADPLRFMTVDRWETREHRDRARQMHARAFREIDERCEAFTESESFIGDFEVA